MSTNTNKEDIKTREKETILTPTSQKTENETPQKL